jgi:20S proteasome alpha/beta subunit
MERRLVALLGSTAKHILGGLRRALRAVALTFLIVALIVAGVTEVVGAYLTRSFPTGPTHLAAAALAIAFGYAAAMTVAIEEILRAIIKAVELIVEEAEKVEKVAVHELAALGHEAGQEAVKLGHVAVTDTQNFGRMAASDAGAVGHAAASLVGGAVGGVEHAFGGMEHAVGSHLHHHAGGAAPAGADDSAQR